MFLVPTELTGTPSWRRPKSSFAWGIGPKVQINGISTRDCRCYSAKIHCISFDDSEVWVCQGHSIWLTDKGCDEVTRRQGGLYDESPCGSCCTKDNDFHHTSCPAGPIGTRVLLQQSFANNSETVHVSSGMTPSHSGSSNIRPLVASHPACSADAAGTCGMDHISRRAPGCINLEPDRKNHQISNPE